MTGCGLCSSYNGCCLCSNTVECGTGVVWAVSAENYQALKLTFD